MIKKQTIAIIPARSGSKSIKNKNLKILGKKPLLAWAIEASIKSKLFSKVYVSTDSLKYSKIAQKFGNVQILLRPKKISNDLSSDYEMIQHAIDNIRDEYEFIAHIRPTTPTRKISDLVGAVEIFINSDYNSLRSVHEMSESAYKSVEIKNNILKPLKNLNKNMDEINLPRQNFNKTFKPNGVIDIYRKKFILKKKILFGNKVLAYITKFTPEIDNLEDLNYIENIWRKKK